MNQEATTSMERIELKGEHLVEKVKELIHDGNVRRINIKDSDGKSVLEMPVSVGVIGLLVAPKMTAIGTLGALAADYSIEVEREHDETEKLIIMSPAQSGDGAMKGEHRE